MAKAWSGKPWSGKQSPGKAKGGSGKKVANGLVAMSSAAVLAVYGAGYAKTRSAADRLESQVAERRPSIPMHAGGMAPAAKIEMAKLEVPVAAPPTAAEPVSVNAPAEKSPSEKSQPAAVLVKTEKADQPTSAIEAKTIAPAAETTAPPTPAPPAQPAAAPDPYKAIIAAAAGPWKDGSFDGWGTCRHGDLQVTVKIEGGRIVAAPVTNCQTRYSCDIIDKVPPQVIKRQSADVDYVSGATQSTDAYYWALIVALGKAH